MSEIHLSHSTEFYTDRPPRGSFNDVVGRNQYGQVLHFSHSDPPIHRQPPQSIWLISIFVFTSFRIAAADCPVSVFKYVNQVILSLNGSSYTSTVSFYNLLLFCIIVKLLIDPTVAWQSACPHLLSAALDQFLMIIMLMPFPDTFVLKGSSVKHSYAYTCLHSVTTAQQCW